MARMLKFGLILAFAHAANAQTVRSDAGWKVGAPLWEQTDAILCQETQRYACASDKGCIKNEPYLSSFTVDFQKKFIVTHVPLHIETDPKVENILSMHFSSLGMSLHTTKGRTLYFQYERSEASPTMYRVEAHMLNRVFGNTIDVSRLVCGRL